MLGNVLAHMHMATIHTKPNNVRQTAQQIQQKLEQGMSTCL